MDIKAQIDKGLITFKQEKLYNTETGKNERCWVARDDANRLLGYGYTKKECMRKIKT